MSFCCSFILGGYCRDPCLRIACCRCPCSIRLFRVMCLNLLFCVTCFCAELSSVAAIFSPWLSYVTFRHIPCRPDLSNATGLLCACVVCRFISTASARVPSLLPLSVFSIKSQTMNSVLTMLRSRSNQYVINHLRNWLLYLAKFWRFWIGQFWWISIYYMNQLAISPWQSLSLVGDRCTRSVCREASVAYWKYFFRGGLCNAIVLSSFFCQRLVALQLHSVAIVLEVLEEI